jgi:hypothetical protein
MLIVAGAPVLIGVFWGAPLIARELENGTFRLAWTQSVTRGRWLATKLLVLGLAAIAVTGLLSLIVTWWSNPMFGMTVNRFHLFFFSVNGLAPLGYGAFGFMLGVTTGLLFRRTLPAMAVTLGGYAAVRLAFTYWVRPYYISPAVSSLPLTDQAVELMASRSPEGVAAVRAAVNIPNSWVYSAELVDKAGQKLASDAVIDVGALGGPRNLAERLAGDYHALVTYQPADRFWTFQGIEVAVFLGLAVVLAVFCFWWVRRRIS